MSRTGDCWDNSVAESFFATIKAELIDVSRFATRAAATVAIEDYIERFYNPQRRHSYLGFLCPTEFELKARVAAFAAQCNRLRNRGNSTRPLPVLTLLYECGQCSSAMPPAESAPLALMGSAYLNHRSRRRSDSWLDRYHAKSAATIAHMVRDRGSNPLLLPEIIQIDYRYNPMIAGT